jgi:heme/copper-type cytochrome/quinol oxidase subunit 2
VSTLRNHANAALIAFAAVVCISATTWCTFELRANRARSLVVRAVAHQWWWEFDYPSLGIKTSDVLYLPSATHVRLELASADVIHSFWIAGMKGSVNIMPGETHPLDLVVKSPGELYGNCDSGCGCGTVCMRFRVLASSPTGFQLWAARERLLRAEFKPPHTVDAPACALNAGHERQAERAIPTSHLQRLLDGGESTVKRPLH